MNLKNNKKNSDFVDILFTIITHQHPTQFSDNNYCVNNDHIRHTKYTKVHNTGPFVWNALKINEWYRYITNRANCIQS